MKRLLVIGVAMSIAGCGGAISGLAHNIPDDRPADVRAVLDRIAAAPPRSTEAIVVGLGGEPSELWAFDAASRTMRWHTAVQAESSPHVASRWVVVEEPSGIVVRDLRSGAITARIGVGELALQGADGDGEWAALVVSNGGGVGARSRLFALHGGSVAWELEMEQGIGEPAVRAGMIFVPWAQQNLSVLDAIDHRELARVRQLQGVVGHAIAEDRSVFFGQRGIAMLSEQSVSTAAPFYEPPEHALPGAPEMLRDAYEPPPSPTSAQHRVRLLWRGVAGDGGTAAMEGDTVYAIYFRLVFALDANADRALWVAALPNDIAGVTLVGQTVVALDDHGVVCAIANGQVAPVLETGASASWGHVGGIAVPAASAESTPLRDQLLAVIQNADSRLVPARAFAAHLLGALEDDSVTETLLLLCDDHNLPEGLRTASCDALSTRSIDIAQVTRALERHASFLSDTRSPPVGALARAAAQAHERRAVPLLLAHLRDPETRANDLVKIAEALRTIGDRSAIDPLNDFVRLYHADAAEPGMPEAVAAAITSYAALARTSSASTLRWVIEDSASDPRTRTAAQEALTALEAGPPREAAGQSEVEQTDSSPTSSPSTELPARVDARMVASVLEPIASELRECLVTPGRTHAQARVVLAIMPDGTLETVSVTPDALQACLEALVRTRPFPASRARRRETITHVIRR